MVETKAGRARPGRSVVYMAVWPWCFSLSGLKRPCEVAATLQGLMDDRQMEEVLRSVQRCYQHELAIPWRVEGCVSMHPMHCLRLTC
eukprot:1158194-Pelagomonas_calceolata.AAC.2